MANYRANISLKQAHQCIAEAWLVSLLSLAIILFSGSSAEAATASSLGTMICNMAASSGAYAAFISAISYTAGVFLVANGIFMIKKNSENPNEAPLGRAVIHLVAGAACLSLPEFTNLLITSMFGSTQSANGASAATCGATAPAGSTASLDQLFTNFFGNVNGPIQAAISVVCFTVGVYMVFNGLLKASKYGTDPRGSSVQAIASNLIIGAILISITQVLDLTMTSLFGSPAITNTFAGLNYSSITSNAANAAATNKAIGAVLQFVQVVGLISFVRGWLVLKTVAEGGGQATPAQGLTHIIGGAMCININMVLPLLDKSFGTNIMN